MSAYYNEFDPFAAAWLRELMAAGLIPAGDVDERSIADVRPEDVRGYDQCHFFAGIGGWAEAIRLAGWGDRPVWTGSCPCQPFSVAGKGKGAADERHLWPEFFRLIEACRPPVIFGEQVVSPDVIGSELEAAFVDAVSRGDCAKANKLAKRLVRSAGFRAEPRWLDGVFADLEGISYTCWANDLPAACVGSPHIRQRLFWVADATEPRLARARQGAGDHCNGTHPLPQRERPLNESAGRGTTCRLADSEYGGVRGGRLGATGAAACGVQAANGERQRIRADAGAGGGVERVRLGDTNIDGREGWLSGGADSARETMHGQARPYGATHWSDTRIVHCRDGKARRVPSEPALFPLAHGLSNRVGILRGAGNAIVPAVAAEFVRAFMETRQ